MDHSASGLKIGALASHNGTTLQAVLDACEAGQIGGSVAVVISNNSGSGALARAEQHRRPMLHISAQTHPGAEDEAICAALQAHGTELVLLAGYMKKLGPKTLSAFAGRIINTHPALLPKFGGQGMFGMNVHRAVVDAGETESGCTVHLVDEQYDTGRSLAQVRVPVLPQEDAEALAARVQTAERALLVQVLAELASGERTL